MLHIRRMLLISVLSEISEIIMHVVFVRRKRGAREKLLVFWTFMDLKYFRYKLLLSFYTCTCMLEIYAGPLRI